MRNELAPVHRTLLVLASLVEDQMRRAVSALFGRDAASARLVIAADRDVDAVETLARFDAALARRVLSDARDAGALGERAARRLVEGPLHDPAKLVEAFHASDILRRLERIVAHAATIASMVVYAADGVLQPERRAA